MTTLRTQPKPLLRDSETELSGTPAARSAVVVAPRPERRKQIAAALAWQGIDVVGELEELDEALEVFVNWHPALLVVELRVDTGDDEAAVSNETILDFVRVARERVPSLKAVALTDSLDPALVADAVASGVDTCILSADD